MLVMTIQAQPPPQAPLEPLHLAFVGLVIEAGQMNHSVQNRMRNSAGQAARIAPRVAPSRFRRHGDVADIFRDSCACAGLHAGAALRWPRRSSGAAPFAGKESTSVGPDLPRNLRLSRAMAESLIRRTSRRFPGSRVPSARARENRKGAERLRRCGVDGSRSSEAPGAISRLRARRSRDCLQHRPRHRLRLARLARPARAARPAWPQTRRRP